MFLPVSPLLAADTPSLGTAVIDALIVIVVVFVVLCLLSGIIWLFGRFGGEKKPKTLPAPPTPVTVAPPPPTQSDDEGEIVAAITAAVAMMAPAGTTYQVKKITPAKGAAVQRRSEWAAAAVRQNTSPF